MSKPIESSLAQHQASTLIQPPHPLETESLLEIIMSYLSYEDVASFTKAHIPEKYCCQDITLLIRKFKNKASVFIAAAKVFQIWDQEKSLYKARLLFFRDDKAVRDGLEEYYGEKHPSSLTLSLHKTPLPEVQAVNFIVKNFYKKNSFKHLEELFPLDFQGDEGDYSDIGKYFHDTVFSYINQSKDITLIEAFIQSTWFERYRSHFRNGPVFVTLVQHGHLALVNACLNLRSLSLESVRDCWIDEGDQTWALICQSSKALDEGYNEIAIATLDAISNHIGGHVQQICEEGYQNVFRGDLSYVDGLDEEELGQALVNLAHWGDFEMVDDILNGDSLISRVGKDDWDDILASTVDHDKLELFDQFLSEISYKMRRESREALTKTLEKAFKKGYLNKEGELSKALVLYSSFGLIDVIQTLINSPHKSILTQEEKFNAIYVAIEYGHKQVVKVLLKSDLLDDTEITPLVEGTCLPVVKIQASEESDSSYETLVKNVDRIGDSSINDPFNKHFLLASSLVTALISVSRFESIDFSSIASSQRIGILIVFAWQGELTQIEALVSSLGFMNEISSEGFGFAIVRAAEENHIDVLQCLIKSCTFLSEIPSELGLALDLAALYEHEDIVRFFITSPYSSFILLENLSIHHMAAAGNFSVLQMLVNWDRFEEIELEKFMQAIILSAKNRHLDCLKILLTSPRFIELANDKEDTTLELVASTVMSALNFCIMSTDFSPLIPLDLYKKLLYPLPQLVCEEHTNIIKYQMISSDNIEIREYCEAIFEAIGKKKFWILDILTASPHFKALSEETLLSFVPLLNACKVEASATIKTMSCLALKKDYTNLMQAMLDAEVLSPEMALNMACNASDIMLQLMMKHDSYGSIILNTIDLAKLAKKSEITKLQSLLKPPFVHYLPINALHTFFNKVRNKPDDKHKEISKIISQSPRFQDILTYDQEQAEKPSKRAKLGNG